MSEEDRGFALLFDTLRQAYLGSRFRATIEIDESGGAVLVSSQRVLEPMDEVQE